MRFEAESSRLIRKAAEIARNFGHSYVGSEHLLTAFSCESGWIGRLLGGCGFNEKIARLSVAAVHGSGTPDLPLPQGLTREAKSILYDAGCEARRLGSRGIRKSHIFLSLLRSECTGTQMLLDIASVDRNEIFTRTVEYMQWEGVAGDKPKKGVVDLKLLE